MTLNFNAIKSSKYFCMAPFAHIVNRIGTPHFCCKIENNDYRLFYQEDINSTFHGSKWDSFRKKMLKLEPIKSCQSCYDDELKGLTSLRQDFNQYYLTEHNINNPEIRDIEMAMSNKCNFKCVSCEVKFSSFWYDDEKILEKIIPRQGYDDDPQMSDSDYENFDIIDSSHLLKNINLENINTIRLLGGEPFIDNNLLNFVKKLNLQDLTMIFTTNCSVFPKKWMTTLDEVKTFIATFSIDGTYDIGEFVRYGFKQKVFERNLIKWLIFLENKKRKIFYHYMCGIMNVFDFENTNEYLKQFDGHVWIEMIEEPSYLNLKYLPDKTKKWILEQIENDVIEFHLWSGDYDENHCVNFLKYIFFLESHRGKLPLNIVKISDNLIKEMY